MAESLNDAVFWLPSLFLADDDVSLDKESTPVNKKDGLEATELNPSLCFPIEFPYEFDSLDSALNSSIESVMGSTKTETCSDEDFLAGLTRRLTQSSTQKLAVPAGSTQDKLESWTVVGSPESTLSGIGSWSVSSNGSPNGPSLVSSPPTTPFRGQDDTWDLISAAAGQVARLKMSNSTATTEAAAKYNPAATNNNIHARSLVAPHRSSSPVHVMKNPNFGLYTGQSVNFDVANTNQYQQYVKQVNMLKAECGSVRGRQQVLRPTWSSHSQPQQIHNKVRNFGYENARCGRPLGQHPVQSAWPLLQDQQHQHHQQQRPVFLGGSVVKRECPGTGVFLPRRYGNNASDSRKKSVPTKVVQAMNLNFNDMNCNGHAQQPFNTGFGSNYDGLIARRNALITLQRRSIRPDAAPKHEIHLPQEWTY